MAGRADGALAERSLEAAKARLREAARGLEGEGLEWFHTHPYPALGIAAAVGFIAGRFPKLRRTVAQLIVRYIWGKT